MASRPRRKVDGDLTTEPTAPKRQRRQIVTVDLDPTDLEGHLERYYLGPHRPALERWEAGMFHEWWLNVQKGRNPSPVLGDFGAVVSYDVVTIFLSYFELVPSRYGLVQPKPRGTRDDIDECPFNDADLLACHPVVFLMALSDAVFVTGSLRVYHTEAKGVVWEAEDISQRVEVKGKHPRKTWMPHSPCRSIASTERIWTDPANTKHIFLEYHAFGVRHRSGDLPAYQHNDSHAWYYRGLLHRRNRKEPAVSGWFKVTSYPGDYWMHIYAVNGFPSRACSTLRPLPAVIIWKKDAFLGGGGLDLSQASIKMYYNIEGQLVDPSVTQAAVVTELKQYRYETPPRTLDRPYDPMFRSFDVIEGLNLYLLFAPVPSSVADDSDDDN